MMFLAGWTYNSEVPVILVQEEALRKAKSQDLRLVPQASVASRSIFR
jgi:hypothetical protein